MSDNYLNKEELQATIELLGKKLQESAKAIGRPLEWNLILCSGSMRIAASSLEPEKCLAVIAGVLAHALTVAAEEETDETAH